MQVTAFSTPSCPEWRWRIVNYAGEIIEESHDLFPTISAAVAISSCNLASILGGKDDATLRASSSKASSPAWAGGTTKGAINAAAAISSVFMQSSCRWLEGGNNKLKGKVPENVCM